MNDEELQRRLRELKLPGTDPSQEDTVLSAALRAYAEAEDLGTRAEQRWSGIVSAMEDT